jgi:hypothetical protein
MYPEIKEGRKEGRKEERKKGREINLNEGREREEEGSVHN